MADRGSQVRIVDPVLSQVIQGYISPAATYTRIFPTVEVLIEGFKVPNFGAKLLKRWITTRAMGGQRARMEVPIEDMTDVVLHEESIEIALDRREIEEAERNVAGGAWLIKSKTTRAKMLKGQIDRTWEIQAATALTTAGNYNASNRDTPAPLWNAANSTPIEDIFAAKEVVRQSIGADPSKMWVSAPCWNVLSNHEDVVDRIKHTQIGVVTPQLLAQLLQLDEVIVCKSVYSTDGTTVTDIWGDEAGLIWTPPQAEADKEVPSMGYFFRKMGYPNVASYADERVNSPEVQYVEDIGAIKLLSDVAGYLFVNPLA